MFTLIIRLEGRFLFEEFVSDTHADFHHLLAEQLHVRLNDLP